MLSAQLEKLDEIKLVMPTEANGVFVDLPARIATGLRAKGWKFYDFTGDSGARFMCSWATTKADIQPLIEDIKSV